MKYNLSKIMRNAWAMIKATGVSMSVAIKASWKAEKEIKMEYGKTNYAESTEYIGGQLHNMGLLICRHDEKGFHYSLQDDEIIVAEVDPRYTEESPLSTPTYVVMKVAALQGSPKQVAWAEDIRRKQARELYEDLMLMGKSPACHKPLQTKNGMMSFETVCDGILKAFASETSAKAYIDSRDDIGKRVRARIAKQLFA